MRKEEIFKITASIYDKSEKEIIDALLRIEEIADETLHEGLLMLDELRENMIDEDFPAKEYLLLLMMWVCDGMEPEYIKNCMENMIDSEENQETKVLAHLYFTGLRCIQLYEPSSIVERQRYLASLFPIKAHDKLFGIMQEFTDAKRIQRNFERGINLLMIHYDVENNEELDNYLSEIPFNNFKEIYRKLKEEDIITMLLICGDKLHTRMLDVIPKEFQKVLENYKHYSYFIRKQRIKEAMNNWKKCSELEV